MASTKQGTLRRLTCCCCGGDAGRWHQHWNRDTGFGICRRCAGQQAAEITPEEMASLYGAAGVNFGLDREAS